MLRSVDIDVSPLYKALESEGLLVRPVSAGIEAVNQTFVTPSSNSDDKTASASASPAANDARPLTISFIKTLVELQTFLPIIYGACGIRFDALFERALLTLQQHVDATVKSMMWEKKSTTTTSTASNSLDTLGKALTSSLVDCRLTATLVHHLISTYTNASSPRPFFFLEPPHVATMLSLVLLFQERVALHVFLPAKTEHLTKEKARLEAEGLQCVVDRMRPSQFARVQSLGRSVLSFLWRSCAFGAVTSEHASAVCALFTGGTSPSVPALKDSAADSSGDKDSSSHNAAAALLLAPIVFASFDLGLRVALVSVVETIASILLEAPREDKALEMATDLIHRCLLSAGPFELWEGNRLTVTRTGWANLLQDVICGGFPTVLATHADLSQKVREIILTRLGDSKHYRANVVDIAVLALTDPKHYLDVLEQFAAIEDDHQLLTSSFGTSLYSAQFASTDMHNRLLLTTGDQRDRLKLLLCYGMIHVVCGSREGGGEGRRRTAIPQPTPLMKDLLRKVSDYVPNVLPAPCDPLSPQLTNFLLDAVLNGYLQCNRLASASSLDSLGIAVTAPPSHAVALCVLSYPPLILSLRLSPIGAAARCAKTLHSCSEALLSATLKSKAVHGGDGGDENKKKTAGHNGSVSVSIDALRTLSDGLLPFATLLFKASIGPVAQCDGDAISLSHTAPPSFGSNTLIAVDTVANLASLPSKLTPLHRIKMIEKFLEEAVEVLLQIHGGRDSSKDGARAVVGWARERLDRVMNHPLLSIATKTAKNDSDDSGKTADSSSPSTTSSTTQSAASPSSSPPPTARVANVALMRGLVAPLSVMRQPRLVSSGRVGEGSLLAVWVQNAAKVLSHVCDPSAGIDEETQEVVGTLAHDVLVAPIRSHSRIAALILPTYVALFAPPPPPPLPAPTQKLLPPSSHQTPYPRLPLPLLKYFAAFIRPCIQALENCHAAPIGDLLLTDANDGLVDGGETSSCGPSKEAALGGGVLALMARQKGSDNGTAEAREALSSCTVLRGELLLVKALYDNIVFLLTPQQQANGGGSASVAKQNFATLSIYMNALLFLLLVNDTRVLRQVCGVWEVLLLRHLHKKQREQDFWMRNIENIISVSNVESTKTELVLWWMKLGDQMRKTASKL